MNNKLLFCRGVLQSLIEKHFPAPDRQKLYSLLGINLSAKKTLSPTDDNSTQAEQKGKKRKGNKTLTLMLKVYNSFKIELSLVLVEHSMKNQLLCLGLSVSPLFCSTITLIF